MNQTTTIANSLTLRSGRVVKNRFLKSAMSEQLANSVNDPTPELGRLYETWSMGGAAVLVTGNVMVSRNALGEPANVVLDEQADLEAFRRWAAAAKSGGSDVWMQINHPGKQSPNFLSKTPVAPSAIKLAGLDASFNPPRALEPQEIEDIIEAFAVAARLAKHTGFDGVQVHCAHGYLVSQFLSPRHNQRDDEWGGSLANRMRFLHETLRRVREAVGDGFSLSVKINSADFKKGGLERDEALEILKSLDQFNLDVIEISGGTYESPVMMAAAPKQSTIEREAYFIEFARLLKHEISTPLVVTGGFRSVSAMNEALSAGDTAMIGIARPLNVYPDLPNRALEDASYRAHMKHLSSGVSYIDRNAMLELYWHERQIKRLGEGKAPQPDAGVLSALWFMFKNLGAGMFGKRRA